MNHHNYPDFKRPSQSTDGWTDERIICLKKLWSDGLSAGQIAAELGGVTRNGVIGKVHRLGLSGRAKRRSSAAPRPRKARVYRPPVVPARTYGNAAIDTQPVEEPVPELLDIPFAQRKTLLQLNAKTCRWPVGDPASADFFFCGGDVMGERPYCSYHYRVAYQPARDRRTARSFKDEGPGARRWS